MIEFFRHQTTAADLLKREKRVALWLDMGLGKTLSILKAIDEIGKNALIIVPNYLRFTWEAEIKKWFPHMSYVILGPENRVAGLKCGARVTVASYDTMKIEKSLIAQTDFPILVFDESQCIKDKKSLQTKVAWQLARLSEYVAVMTGTPIGNSFGDYYGQYRTIRPDLFPSYTVFKNNYLVMGGYMGYKEIGTKNQDQFQALTEGFTLRLKKADCVDLPDKIYLPDIEVEWTPDLYKAYRDMATKAVLELEGVAGEITAPMVVIQLLRLQQICNGWVGYFKDEDRTKPMIKELTKGHPPKLKALLEYLTENANLERVIIWCTFRHDLKKVAAACAEQDWTTDVISGENESTRDEVKRRFMAGQIRCLCIQNTITAGMNELKEADIQIFYSNSHKAIARQQAEDRTHRIGTKRPPMYIDIRMRSSIERRIKQALEKKKDIASIIDKNKLREIFLSEEE